MANKYIEGGGGGLQRDLPAKTELNFTCHTVLTNTIGNYSSILWKALCLVGEIFTFFCLIKQILNYLPKIWPICQ